MKRRIIAALFVAIGFTVAAAGSHAEGAMETTYNITPDGVAIGGWDTVAYFTQDRAVEGSSEFSHDWEGATWLFTSQENLDLFIGDPEAYAPQFGGWCAYALSTGEYAAEVDPGEAWTVHEGQLFLNWSDRVREQWLRYNVDHGIAVGRDNWAEVIPQIQDGSVQFSRKADSPWDQASN